MLKFDPDDPDDDEPNGAPPKVTIKLGGDDVRPSEPSDGAGDRSVPDKSRQNTQHEQQKVKMHYFAYDRLFRILCLGSSVCWALNFLLSRDRKKEASWAYDFTYQSVFGA
jgi:hypothetical protein